MPDPYMPERQVMAKDIVAPKNEAEILGALGGLYADTRLAVKAPRWTLCEYWQRGEDLVVCCGNLRKGHDGGPVEIVAGEYPLQA